MSSFFPSFVSTLMLPFSSSVTPGTNYPTQNEGEVAVRTGSIMLSALKETAKQTIRDNKIGQLVPHMDTSEIRYGVKVARKIAGVCGRTECVPIPKLVQLQSLSELYQSFGEAYPQRLDIVCILFALFPLLSLKMREDGFVLHIYVFPFVSAQRKFKQATSRPFTLVKNQFANVSHHSISVTKFLLKTFVVNLVKMSSVIDNAIQDNPETWGAKAFRQLDRWCIDKTETKGRVESNDANEVSKRINNLEENLSGSSDFGRCWFGSVSSNSLGPEMGSSQVPADFSYVNSEMIGKYLTPQSQKGNNSFYYNVKNMISKWVGNTQNRQVDTETKGWEKFSSEEKQLQLKYQNQDVYRQFHISKRSVVETFKFLGMAYALPCLVFPQQFFFGVSWMVARTKGSIVVGKKIWYPFEEMVEMLPSISSPIRDLHEKDHYARSSSFPSSWITLSIAVFGCGLAGVFFGGIGGPRSNH